MIYKGGEDQLIGRYLMLPTGVMMSAVAIYRGEDLVWMSVRSCYGRGVWIDNKPWVDNDKWKNNR